MTTRHQPSGPGATGGLPGDNADPGIDALTPDEAASTISGAGVAPVGEDGSTTGTARFEEEDLPADLSVVEEDADLPEGP